METLIDLKQIERKAYRSIFQDGILDITLGLLMTSSSLAILFRDFKPIRLTITAIIVIALPMFFYLSKKMITVPRMGTVKFGKKRKRKRNLEIVIILVIVAVSITMAVLAMTGTMPETLQEILRGYGSAVIFGILVFLFFGFGALLSDFPRLYLYALFIGGSIFLSECFYNNLWPHIHGSIPFLISGVLIISIGTVYLLKFLRDYPYPDTGDIDG